MKKRKYIRALFIVAYTLSFIGCGSSAKQTDGLETSAVLNEDSLENNVTIRIADTSDGSKYELANELGLWEEEFAEDGIRTESISISDGPAFIDAINTDNVDFGIFGTQPILAAIANGSSLKIVGISGVDSNAWILLANAQSDINSIADLKGKKVAYSVGSNSELVLTNFLAAENLTIDDIENVNLSGSEAQAALSTGDIDALTFYTNNGGTYDTSTTKVIANYTDYGRNIHVIAANTKFLDEHPDLAARVLKVYAKTFAWMNEHPDEAKELLKKLGQYTDEQADIVYESEDREVTLTPEDIDAINEVSAFLYENKTIKNEISADEAADTQYLKEAGILN